MNTSLKSCSNTCGNTSLHWCSHTSSVRNCDYTHRKVTRNYQNRPKPSETSQASANAAIPGFFCPNSQNEPSPHRQCTKARIVTARDRPQPTIGPRASLTANVATQRTAPAKLRYLRLQPQVIAAVLIRNTKVPTLLGPYGDDPALKIQTAKPTLPPATL